jgi:hypothetical protein
MPRSDVDRHSEEEHGIEDRRQDFEAVVAEGLLGVGALFPIRRATSAMARAVVSVNM